MRTIHKPTPLKQLVILRLPLRIIQRLRVLVFTQLVNGKQRLRNELHPSQSEKLSIDPSDAKMNNERYGSCRREPTTRTRLAA